MIIRAATTSDAHAIAQILNPVIRDTAITFNSEERGTADIAKAIETQPCTLVAEEDGAVIGYASYDQLRKGIGYARAMEHTILLADTARGKGAGRALMLALSEHARAAGVGSLWAGISGENPGAIAFHKALGFEHIATLPKVGFKFGRWMDLVFLRQWLEPDH